MKISKQRRSQPDKKRIKDIFMPIGMNVITISFRVKAEILNSIFPENGI